VELELPIKGSCTLLYLQSGVRWVLVEVFLDERIRSQVRHWHWLTDVLGGGRSSKLGQISALGSKLMIGEIRRLVTDEPVEFEK
jgi:hypothetical protein